MYHVFLSFEIERNSYNLIHDHDWKVSIAPTNKNYQGELQWLDD